MSDKLPPSLQLPVRKSALKSLMLQHVPDVELVSQLHVQQDIRQETRDLLKDEGIVNILECRYWATGENSFYSFFSGDGPSVFLLLYGADKKTWQERHMQSKYVEELFSNVLNKITSVKAWDTIWQTEIQWFPGTFKLEAHSHIDRKGFREEKVLHTLLCKSN